MMGQHSVIREMEWIDLGALLMRAFRCADVGFQWER